MDDKVRHFQKNFFFIPDDSGCLCKYFPNFLCGRPVICPNSIELTAETDIVR
jgi:hypothetical protein